MKYYKYWWYILVFFCVVFITSREDEVLLNKTTGYYMKSRKVDLAEGGISIGNAAMDSAALV